MTYWQIAAGEGARDYSDVFLRYGVVLRGSGRPGSFSEHPENYKGHKGWRRRIVALAEGIKANDVIILKKGHGSTGKIIAAGRVTGGYEWLTQFDDVEGWDIRHGRRVSWVKASKPIALDGLARGTISRVKKVEPQRVAGSLLKNGQNVEACEIPQPASDITEEYLVGSLIENGLRPADAEAVIRAIFHVRRLAGWYRSHGQDLSEHEIRTFLIIPILLALGWSEQRIKIEWNYTDISLFQDVFNKGVKSASPRIIVETKRMGMGLGHAEPQVRKYAERFPECDILVTSSGERYLLYTKEQGKPWDATRMKDKHLCAYLNLFSLRDRHPYLAGVGGAPDLLKRLMPGV